MSETANGIDGTATAPQGGVGADIAARLNVDYLSITSGDAVGIVERLRESHADERGRAFLLRLDPLIARLGAKWQTKGEFVWQHLKDSFARRFQEPDWCVPVNEESWLAIIPTQGAHRGAHAVGEIWNELCDFFVGALPEVTPPLFEALADGVDRLKLKPIKLDAYFDRDEETAAAAKRVRAMGEGQEPGVSRAAPVGQMVNVDSRKDEGSIGHSTPIGSDTAGEGPGPSPAMRPMGNRPVMVAAMVTYAGRSLKVASAVEPLFEMKKMVMIGHRLEPLVMENIDNALLDRKSLANMDWNLREQVDIVNIEQGLNLLRMRDADQRKMLMVVPAAFSTFASGRARTKITTDVAKAANEMGLKVLFEVRGLDGVPPHRVLEIVSMIKPFCMTVVGNVTPERKAISSLSKCGLSGICVEYDGVKREDAALSEYLGALSVAAKSAAGAFMVQGFDNYRQMAVARLAGVTHASIKATALLSPKANGNAA